MSSSSKPVKVVLGAGFIGGTPGVSGSEADEYISLFRKHGHVEIDSAATYPIDNFGASEKYLGQHGDLGWAQVSTKCSAMGERANSIEKVREGIASSEANLNGVPIDIYYFHLPEIVTPMEEQARAMDEQFRAGKFKRFGISNFAPEQVEGLMQIAEEKGYVKPSVLQGQYNLFGRKGEEELLPILRKYGISYYAYSPAAAGFLTGKVSRESSNLKATESRWSKEHMAGQMYAANYFHDPIFEASQKIQDVAKKHGISGHGATLRWALHHSALSGEHGDAIIIGARNNAQLKDNLEICNAGPLPEEVVKAIDDAWPSVRENAPWAYINLSKPFPKDLFEGKMEDVGVKT